MKRVSTLNFTLGYENKNSDPNTPRDEVIDKKNIKQTNEKDIFFGESDEEQTERIKKQSIFGGFTTWKLFRILGEFNILTIS